jgi:ubiquitin-activating enzyme E1
MSQQNTEIDESLYSRQLYVLGKDAMQSMRKSNVLIHGLNGCGLEIAKCVILAGVNSVVLHDTKLATYSDLSTQYYLSENDVNKNNRTIVVDKLKELNPYVKVSANTENTIVDLIDSGSYHVVVCTDSTYQEQNSLNKLCHEKGIKFISCNLLGGFANIFCDFGENFTVKDIDGEEPKTGIIVEMSITDKIVFKTAEPHNLASDDIISIDGLTPVKVKKIVNRFEFCVPKDDELFVTNQTYNNFTQIKTNKVLNFLPFESAVSKSEIIPTDISDFTRPRSLHVVFQAINLFQVKYNRLPSSWDENDADEVYEFCTQFDKDINKTIVHKLCYTLQGQLCPVHAFIGSICAQEVLKACSGKFHPIYQWLYYDVLDCLPNVKPIYDMTIHDRYDGQRVIFGDEFQNKLSNAKIFLVGSGAIGCEHLKNFAMMGIGNIIVTDMDTIEKSNLNRQFLFRPKDIGNSKSVTAARAIMDMNPKIKVISHQNRVGNETLNIYNEEFFNGLTCVANALDNVQARLFVDSLCVTHKKPLFESGTLGTKGNIQTIIPNLTESYGSTSDPPEKDIPVCTLKNFPYLIEHTIQWARDMFEGYFSQVPSNTVKFLKDKEALRKMTPTEIICISNDIKQVYSNWPKSYEDCLRYGFNVWHEQFRNQIQQLRHKFPQDSKTAEGADFWSGTKKFPTDLHFDVNNEADVLFVRTFANLWANVFSVQISNPNDIVEYLRTLEVPLFRPMDDAEISVTEDEEKKRKEKEAAKYDETQIVDELPEISEQMLNKLTPLSFEKDDDTNFHIDFVTATANLRAKNYEITQADRHKVKGIAGKIIPAIATTTSLVSGLVSVEVYKLLLGINEIEKYRNAFINLALPFFGLSEPVLAKKSKLKNFLFTFWDSFKFNDVTVGEIVEFINEKYDAEVNTITSGSMILYATYLQPRKQKERYNKLVKEIYKEIGGNDPISPLILTVVVDDDEETENNNKQNINEVPQCKVYF